MNKRIIGLDVGDKTIGVAISDPLRIIAQGVTTIDRVGIRKDTTKIIDFVKEYDCDTIVIGLNINLNGNIENLIGNIICGDFNEKNIYLNNFEDVSMKLNKDNIPTFLNSRIDYCFEDTNLNITSYEVDKVYMSDHFPIIVDFS